MLIVTDEHWSENKIHYISLNALQLHLFLTASFVPLCSHFVSSYQAKSAQAGDVRIVCAFLLISSSFLSFILVTQTNSLSLSSPCIFYEAESQNVNSKHTAAVIIRQRQWNWEGISLLIKS